MMTNVLIAPVLTLMMWKHSFFPCETHEGVDADAFMDTFLGLVRQGLAPQK
jgi:hypothetical protein